MTPFQVFKENSKFLIPPVNAKPCITDSEGDNTPPAFSTPPYNTQDANAPAIPPHVLHKLPHHEPQDLSTDTRKVSKYPLLHGPRHPGHIYQNDLVLSQAAIEAITMAIKHPLRRSISLPNPILLRRLTRLGTTNDHLLKLTQKSILLNILLLSLIVIYLLDLPGLFHPDPPASWFF